MRLIGGIVSHDRNRALSAPVLRSLAVGGGENGDVTCATDGPVGFVSSLGPASLESSDGVWLIADADLTNLDELRSAAGLRAGARNLLAALYERDGVEFVRYLRGAFAVALWDRTRQMLLLAVDQLGIRRLHYATGPRQTAFASRAVALAALPGHERRVDLTAVYNYLNFGYIPAPGSAFAGVHRLPPGHRLIVRDGAATVEQYWDIRYQEHPLREAEAATTLYAMAGQAVAGALHGMNPKATGAFLSGGTDSSTVVGLMSQATGERANAFSVGFADERYNELHYAGLAAGHFGATHYTHVVTPDEAFAVLPRLLEAYDEPFGNNSAIGTFVCARLARECGVATLLAGDGGDEIFGGNERYRTDRIFARYHRVPSIVRRGVLEPILSSLPDDSPGVLGKTQRYVRRANIQNPRRFYSYEFFFAQEIDELLDAGFRAAIDAEAPYAVLDEHYARAGAGDELNRLLYLDLKLTIGDNDLLKVTRTAELAGVAVRFPLLDLPLVEFTGTWPARFKLRGLEKRYLFKKTFKKLLPPATLAKRKHGFGVPTSAWLKSHPDFEALAHDTLSTARCRQRGYFRPGALERLLRLHAADSTPYYGDVLWTVLMLELWHQHHVDGAPTLPSASVAALPADHHHHGKDRTG